MLQTHHQRFLQKSFKIQHKYRKKDHFLKQISKLAPGSVQSAVNKLIKIHHRRKFQMAQQKQLSGPIPVRNSQHISQQTQKQSQLSPIKRHTHHISGLHEPTGKIKKNRLELISNTKAVRSRIKYSMCSTQGNNIQTLSKSKSGFKLNEKKLKGKTQQTQTPQHPKTSKRHQKLNQTAVNFNRNMDEISFLSLIQKFKFQNLKTVAGITPQINSPSVSNNGKPQISLKRSTCFAPFQRENNSWCKNKYIQKFSKTTARLPAKHQSQAPKLARKISILSPWQPGGESSAMSTVELCEHS